MMMMIEDCIIPVDCLVLEIVQWLTKYNNTNIKALRLGLDSLLQLLGGRQVKGAADVLALAAKQQKISHNCGTKQSAVAYYPVSSLDVQKSYTSSLNRSELMALPFLASSS